MRKRRRHGLWILDSDYTLLQMEAERQSEDSPTKISVAEVVHQMIQEKFANLAKSTETTPKHESKTKRHIKKKPAKRAPRRSFTMAEAVA